MRKIVLASVVTTLVGCSMGHRDPVEAKQALNQAINRTNSRQIDQVPPSVEADLMPDMDTLTASEPKTLQRFPIQAEDVEAKAFCQFRAGNRVHCGDPPCGDWANYSQLDRRDPR